MTAYILQHVEKFPVLPFNKSFNVWILDFAEHFEDIKQFDEFLIHDRAKLISVLWLQSVRGTIFGQAIK